MPGMLSKFSKFSQLVGGGGALNQSCSESKAFLLHLGASFEEKIQVPWILKLLHLGVDNFKFLVENYS